MVDRASANQFERPFLFGAGFQLAKAFPSGAGEDGGTQATVMFERRALVTLRRLKRLTLRCR